MSETFIEKRRKPEYCKHYPLCEHLKTLVGKLALRLLDTYTSILSKEVELICSQCNDFERMKIP